MLVNMTLALMTYVLVVLRFEGRIKHCDVCYNLLTFNLPSPSSPTNPSASPSSPFHTSIGMSLDDTAKDRGRLDFFAGYCMYEWWTCLARRKQLVGIGSGNHLTPNCIIKQDRNAYFIIVIIYYYFFYCYSCYLVNT